MTSALARLTALIALLVTLAIAGAAIAQEAPDYDAFQSIAASVETDLQEDRISDAAFETLRAKLVDWRKTFLDAQNANEVQIDALAAQIDALGAPPAEGQTEPDDIAERRAELTDQLAKAREPRIRAEEAHARANTLIGRIDTTLRERQTDELFQLQRSPLDPGLWQQSVVWLGQSLSQIRTELSDNINTRSERGTLWDRLPLTVILVVLAIFLIARGPGLVERLIRRVEARTDEHGRVVYGFFLSLGTIAAPLIGISLINAALISTGYLGPTGRSVALGINFAILATAGGRWLGRRVFPVRSDMPAAMALNDKTRARGRKLSQYGGLLVGLLFLINALDDVGTITPEIISVFSLPVFLLLGIVLFRVGRILSGRYGSLEDADVGPNFQRYVAGLTGWAVRMVAVIGPIAALIGYFYMAEALLFPTAMTLAVLALLASLHHVVRAAYGIARGLSSEESSQALMPVLFSFALAVMSLPVIALIWGARTTDIEELWTRVKVGVPLGDATISPGAILMFAVVFGLGYFATRLIQGTLKSSVLPRTQIDKGGQNAIVSGLGYVGLTLAAVFGITAAGIDLSNLAIIVGALGVGIGFGLQNIVNNFVSGIILLIERPIGEGDWVEINGQMGIVKAISVRSTRIETFDRTDVIVPNGDLISGTVTNWTRGNSIGRVIVPVGVAYGTDTRKVEKVLMEIAEAHPIVAMNPPPSVVFKGFGADSMDFEIRAILTDVNFILSVHSDMNHEIARRFAEEGIEIPFAQRDVWLRNPEALVRSQSSGNESTGTEP